MCFKCDLNSELDHFSMRLPAFFYQIRETDGVEIESIVRRLKDLDETNDAPLPYTFSLSSLFASVNTERFYTYRGEN